MNRLEPAIRSVMSSLGIEQLPAVADKTGIPKSAIYKIIRGEIGLSPENLRKLVTGLSSNPLHQFTILSAHLYDEAERGSELANKIRINYSDTEGAGVGFSDLPQRLQYELRLIGDAIKDGDTDLGGTISWLARMLDSRCGDTDTVTHFAPAPYQELAVAEDQAPYSADPALQQLQARAAAPTPPPTAPQPPRRPSPKGKG